MRALTLICGVALSAAFACGGSPKVTPKSKASSQSVLSPKAYSHYLRGRLAVFEGDFRLALRELKAASRAAPKEATIAIALASAFYESGNSKSAIATSNQSTERWPKSFPVWVQAGDFQRGLANHAAAAKHYQKAIALGARSEAVHLAYAEQLNRLGDTKREERQYRKLLAKTAGSAEVHYRLGLLLHEAGKQPAATKHAHKASLLSPYDLRVWALLSTSLSKEGREKEARDTLRQPFDRSGGNTFVSDQLLTQLLDLGNHKSATELVTILDRDDLPIDTRIGMGHMLLRLGEFEEALAIGDRLDKELASNSAIAELRFRALRALRRNDEAEKQVLSITEDQKGYALTRAMLADLLADQGDFDRARQVADEALKLHPDNADLIIAKASVAEKSGKADEARGILRAAMERHPSAQRPRFALAELESRAGQTETAISLINPLIAQDPRDFSALNYVGYNLIEDKTRHPRARSLLLRALELSPDSSFILDSYGWLLFKNGDYKRAAEYLERAARLSRTEPELLWHLAELRWKQEKRAEALRLLERAESLALDRNLRGKIQSRRQILRARP